MATTGPDRLRLTPKEVAVEAAKSEIETRQARLEEIKEERATLHETVQRDYLLEREEERLKADIRAYQRVINNKGDMSFEKATRPPGACVA
jgi:FtsZ-binding cell division protein ZapB